MSTDLLVDANRDLEDIGATQIEVRNITDFPLSGKIKMQDGVCFMTYAALVSKGEGGKRRIDQVLKWLKGSTGSADGCVLRGLRVKSGLRPLLGPAAIAGASPNRAFRARGSFDEAHKAKNLVPEEAKINPKTGRLMKSRVSSKTAEAVHELQEKLPEARFVYCSATGASDLVRRAAVIRSR